MKGKERKRAKKNARAQILRGERNRSDAKVTHECKRSKDIEQQTVNIIHRFVFETVRSS